MASDRRRSRGGFTLLEVLVSMAILATAFAAVLRLHSDSMDMVIASRIHTKALELAQYKMTEVELSGVRNVTMLSGDFADQAPDYHWELQIEPAAMAPWSKVTVVVANRNLKQGGRVHLTSYLLSAPLELEQLRR
ncbi:MAG: prepilin-type N-terminal cleavage/methylation domain-containing protein [Deltaproteobacteria bacterium]|nr:prepilin-type N-terminal cleavage/methylation domain-containing protein [Deltaproteobacteria bacterium]